MNKAITFLMVGTSMLFSCNTVLPSSQNSTSSYYCEVIEDADGNVLNDECLFSYGKDENNLTYFCVKGATFPHLVVPSLSPDGEPIERIKYAQTYYTKLITLPDTIKIIDANAFTFQRLLQHINIPKQLKEIQCNTFQNCYELESIEFPVGLQRICSNAFTDCYSLSEVFLSNTITEIESQAFASCSLKSIYIPKSVTKMGDCVFEDPLDPDFTIYCEADEKPEGWDDYWNYLYSPYWMDSKEIPVVWSAKRILDN